MHARESALAWWEAQGIKGMWAGKEFNERVMKFMMTNQHRKDYSERVEVSGTLAKIDFSQLTDEQLAAIAGGEHPYAVLAPKREVLVAGPVTPTHGSHASPPAIEVVEAETEIVVQATEVESVVQPTIPEKVVEPTKEEKVVDERVREEPSGPLRRWGYKDG